MTDVRPAAVAGMFYPDRARDLEAVVAHALDGANAGGSPSPDAPAALPKAIIAPHAGYVYSGTSPPRPTRG